MRSRGRAVRAAQHPAAGQGTAVRELLTGVLEQSGQELGERRAFWQREVDPASGRRDGHPDQACGVHVAPSSVSFLPTVPPESADPPTMTAQGQPWNGLGS